MLTPFTESVTTWLHQHPHLGLLFTFMIAFLESIAIVGSIIPGSVFLTLIGILIGSGVLPLLLTLWVAILGALAGDLFSYAIGWRYRESLTDYWPLKHYPRLISKGECFIQRHGGKSVFIGRFTGPLRPIVPLAAGCLHMPWLKFFCIDVISALLWAPVYILPGVLIGAASVELEPTAATHVIAIVLAALFVLWGGSILIHRIMRWQFTKINTLLERCWQCLRRHPSLQWCTHILYDANTPDKHYPLILCFAFIVLYAGLAVLTYHVQHQGTLTSLNHSVFHLFQSMRTPLLDKIAVAYTFLGEKEVVLTLLFAVTTWLLLSKHYRAAYYYLANGLYAAFAGKMMKHWIHSPRPQGLNVLRSSSSFPSGHTTLTVAAFGFLAVLFMMQVPKSYRRPICLLTTLLIVLMIISRLYLGAHWITDVTGGLLLSSSVILCFTLFYRRCLISAIPMKSTFVVALCALLCAWLYFMSQHYQQQVYAYTLKWPSGQTTRQHWWQHDVSQLPHYRLNRLGQPTVGFNLQWVDTLQKIEQQLSQQGWRRYQHITWQRFVRQLIAKDKTRQLPLLPRLHQNQPPALVMVKDVDPHQPLLVLRLWPSGIDLKNNPLPLWIGTLHYRILWHHHYLTTHRFTLPDFKRFAIDITPKIPVIGR